MTKMPLNQHLADEPDPRADVPQDYYFCTVDHPASIEKPYASECIDIIEGLQMSFSEGEAFKALWRMCAARQGKKKQGNSAIRDAEKLFFYSRRILVAEKGQELENRNADTIFNEDGDPR